MSDYLVSQLKASIERELSRQALKTYNDLAKQMLATLKPSAKCNPVIAEAMHQESEIWQSALDAGLKALQPVVTAEDVIPDFICKLCKQGTLGTINGNCWECWEAIEAAKSIGPCDEPCCAGTVVEMPRRGR